MLVFWGVTVTIFLGWKQKSTILIVSPKVRGLKEGGERHALFSIFPPKNWGLTKVHPRKCSHVSPEKGPFQKGNAGFQPAFFNRYVSSLKGTVGINKNPTPPFFMHKNMQKEMLVLAVT